MGMLLCMKILFVQTNAINVYLNMFTVDKLLFLLKAHGMYIIVEVLT